jgi:hypothetical protein
VNILEADGGSGEVEPDEEEDEEADPQQHQLQPRALAHLPLYLLLPLRQLIDLTKYSNYQTISRSKPKKQKTINTHETLS